MAESSNLPVHFIHGRPALSTGEGQTAAAVAEILLRGFSRTRVTRLISLLRSQSERFEDLPSGWWHTFPETAPLLEGARWIRAIEQISPDNAWEGVDHRPLLLELINTLQMGLTASLEIGEALLEGRALSIWKKALIEGPPTALDVTLSTLRAEDGTEPQSAIVWGPAASIAAAPRPFTWLVGFNFSIVATARSR